MYKLIIFSVLLSMVSCAPNYQFKSNVEVKKIGVAITFKDTIYPQLKEAYKIELDEFISNFNKYKHEFKLYQVDVMDSNSIEFRVDSVKLVSKGQQAAGIGLSALATATAPVGVLFIPQNQSFISVNLSPAIFKQPKSNKPLIFTSGGYFGGKDAQIRKHTKKISKNFEAFFYELENTYKQQRKYNKSTL